MKALVLDGYTDEPACLGVPPFISPYVRLAYGALADAGAEVEYKTIDQWRSGQVNLNRFNLLGVVRNIAVPGKYLRGMPASDKELERIGREFNGTSALSLGVDPRIAPRSLADSYDHICSKDFDASLHDLVLGKEFVDRRRTYDEWNTWLVRGTEACRSHPDHGDTLIAEVQMLSLIHI